MTTREIADRLVALCRQGKNIEAVVTLMSPDVVSVEAQEDPSNPDARIKSGVDAIRAKNEWWVENHVIHSAEVRGPFPLDDRFAVGFAFVVSPKTGPMVGKRMRMEEVALYTVSEGKITREEFFYDMADASFLEEKAATRKPAARKSVQSAGKAVRGKTRISKKTTRSEARTTIKKKAGTKAGKARGKAKVRTR